MEIPSDHQVLLNKVVHEDLSQVGVQVATQVHCVQNTDEFLLACQYGLQLGCALKQCCGQYHVCDKQSHKSCAKN